MTVAHELVSIRRYPVKAMGGESLEFVEVTARGLAGDRQFAVVDAEGKFATGKVTSRFVRHDEVFEYTATSTSNGVRVARHDAARGPWTVGSPTLDAELTGRFGEPMRVLPEADVMHFDSSPVSVVGTASLAWFEATHGFAVDSRRIRVNLVVQTSVPFVEESWTRLEVGTVALDVVKRITRCRVVDLPQDGLTSTAPLLKTLGSAREAKLGVYFTVPRPGTLRVGDAVHTVGSASPPER